MTNAFDILKQDHSKIRKIAADLLKTEIEESDYLQRELLTLKEALHFHQRIEEALLYPSLTRNANTRALTLKAYEEHHIIDNLLEELEAADGIDEFWKAKLMVLYENVIHHLNEEEGQLFPDAQRFIAADTLLEIGNSLLATKKAVPD